MDRREIERDIDRLGRCLDRVETLHAIRSYDFQVQMVRDYLQKTMWKIFGPESKEWESCRSLGVMVGVDMERSPETVFRRRITETVKYLSSLRVSLEDSLADLNDDRSNRMGSLFRHLNLNQRITEAAATLFTQGHRRQAVFDAYLALQEFVQTKAGRPDLDGPDLMRTVFSVSNPILTVNALKTKNDRAEQEGVMHLFEGAALALRNPRAHRRLLDSEEDALDCLVLLSFLAKRADQARAGPTL